MGREGRGCGQPLQLEVLAGSQGGSAQRDLSTFAKSVSYSRSDPTRSPIHHLFISWVYHYRRSSKMKSRLASHDRFRRALGGDLRAFGDLVLEHQKSAHVYAYGLLRDHHLAEDAVQEALVAVYQNLL